MLKALAALALVAALTGYAFADPQTCTPSPKSCGDWSVYYDVGAPICGYTKSCDGEFFPIPIRASFQKQERFHICSYKDGSQCIETQQTSKPLGCGC